MKKEVKTKDKQRSNPINEVLSSSLEKLKTIVDVNTVVGEPIENAFGAIILPISRVSLGFVVGGGEYGKNATKKQKTYPFAGGTGGGVTLTPVGFLTIVGGVTNFIRVEDRTGLDKIGELLPEILKMIDKDKKHEKNK